MPTMYPKFTVEKTESKKLNDASERTVDSKAGMRTQVCSTTKPALCLFRDLDISRQKASLGNKKTKSST